MNAKEIAERMGLDVFSWPLPSDEIHETMVGRSMAVSHDLNDQERRWAIAHGIGHRVLHPGNQIWLRSRTGLAIPFEREAEDFAYGLLVDEAEVLAERLGSMAEVAEHFGIPMHGLWENAPDTWGQVSLL